MQGLGLRGWEKEAGRETWKELSNTSCSHFPLQSRAAATGNICAWGWMETCVFASTLAQMLCAGVGRGSTRAWFCWWDQEELSHVNGTGASPEIHPMIPSSSP